MSKIPPPTLFASSTGKKELDLAITDFAKHHIPQEYTELFQEMVTTAANIVQSNIDIATVRTIQKTTADIALAEELFSFYQDCRKVSVFGSARTHPDEATYQTAMQFSKQIVEQGFMVITGAGEGIMAAGNEGAGTAKSFGLAINLPFEPSVNSFIRNDRKMLQFQYFYTRKLYFIKKGHAFVALPGGFGTMDELFEVITLVQTGSIHILPIVLLDEPNGTYWKFLEQFIHEHLARLNLISTNDTKLYEATDSVERAVTIITQFYHNFIAYSYEGNNIFIQLKRLPDESQIAHINQEFAELLRSGEIVTYRDKDNHQQGITFKHTQNDYAILKLLIDHLNNY